MAVTEYDLLNPTSLTDNYVHQLRQTIDAYLPSYVFVGEALQNALDAIREAPTGPHQIDIVLDFDQAEVTVRDDGPGFPNDPKLLFLGGGRKKGRKLAGQVGVGLKVVLFSSSAFCLRSRTRDESLRFEVDNANAFDAEPRPQLRVPTHFSIDPSPLDHPGTELTYRFPSVEKIPRDYLQSVYEECLPRGLRSDFADTLQQAVNSGAYPTRFAAMLACDLKRNSYLGLTGATEGLAATTVTVTVRCTDPVAMWGAGVGDLLDGQTEMVFNVPPGYLYLPDTVAWATPPKPAEYREKLGEGGLGLSRVSNGYNITEYRSQGDFEQLLTNARGGLPDGIESYRNYLFPRINFIRLTVARIPAFERYLPGGSQRVISANGVITRHSPDLTKGRNQQYVRCFDIVVDVDADLNYGKTQLTDMRLVGRLRQFLNDAYRNVIQNAASRFVGQPNPFEDEERHDAFWSREDLGRPELSQRKVPRDENDVIALFFELTGRGFFPEFSWFGLSQRDRYDGRAVIQRLHDDVTVLENPSESALRTVEFKLRAASIAIDFDREEKNPRDLQLLIAYEEGALTGGQYQFISVEDSSTHERAPDRIFPHVSRVLVDTRSGAEVQVLLLRERLEHFYPPPPPPAAPRDASDE